MSVAVLNGIVSDVSYRNEDNGFSVVRLQAEGNPTAVVCVGVMPSVESGVSVRVQGSWQSHPRFGPQFAVASYEIQRPTTEAAILALLSSGLITNIGDSRARRIVERFGVATLDVLDNEPDRLREVSGIGRKTLVKIKEAWGKQRAIRDLMLFLQEFGVSVGLAGKIHKAYGNDARRVVSENPYELIKDVWGVGFKKADAIAQKLGFEHNSHRRIRAGIVYVLQEALGRGHIFLLRDDLVEKAKETLGVEQDAVVDSLHRVTAAGEAVDDGGALYLPAGLAAEKAVAAMVAGRLTQGISAARDEVDRWLSSYCMRSGWQGDPKQVDAVRGAIVNPLFLLTGGPGTGKTTTLQVLVSYFRETHAVVALAAPTGRAAQRMGSIAGLKALTLHRLLEFRPGGDGYHFARNASNPIEAEVVIVDEVSMIDIFLMRSLLAALSPKTRLVLVGDNHQLPSVGPGAVLAELIAGRVIPHVHLTTIFRQAAQSTIVRAAHEIIQGVTPRLDNEHSDTCFLINEEDPEKCLATIVDLVSNRLPRRYGFDPIADIQVLSPMHKGILGTQNLNRLLQKVLNPSGTKLTRGEVTFCRGDKVMQIRNNYDAGVFNGDIGYVADIEDESTLHVDFDGQRVAYDSRNLDELVHAYCISIHKSQGCEFRAVVIPVSTQHFIMLQRNLLYTALTRARELCLLVGMPSAVAIAVRNNHAELRNTRLAQRVVALCALAQGGAA